LNKGEAIMINPNEPHAYIKGDLIECMVNSNNVVRGGLTPKFKDTETLVKV
jgi:mannose-6-phosphate isomerase